MRKWIIFAAVGAVAAVGLTAWLAGAQFGDFASLVSAAVAVIAMAVSLVQAKSAKDAEGRAELMEKAARDHANAAQLQADAVTEQTALLRAEQDARDAPVFVVKEAVDCYPMESGSWAAKITVEQVGGPRLASVAATVSGERLGRAFHVSEFATGPADEFTDIRPGTTFVVYVYGEEGYVGEGGHVDLRCIEEGGDRTWTRGYGFTVTPAPDSRW